MDLCITFDDGRSDNFDFAVPLLKKYGLTATFFITTGFVDGTFLTDDFGLGRKPIGIEQLQSMSKDGFEIASHGDRHIMQINDYLTSLRKLRNWGLSDGKIGFSVPHTHFTEKSLKEFFDANIDSLAYIRLGRDPRCFSFINKTRYVLYHRLAPRKGLYSAFNRPNLEAPKDLIHFYSTMIKNDVRWSDLQFFLEKNQKSSSPLILMLHSITPKANDMWEWSCQDFESFCSFLSSHSNYHAITMNQLAHNYFGGNHQ